MSMQAGEERIIKALQDRLDYLEAENRFRQQTVRTPATLQALVTSLVPELQAPAPPVSDALRQACRAQAEYIASRHSGKDDSTWAEVRALIDGTAAGESIDGRALRDTVVGKRLKGGAASLGEWRSLLAATKHTDLMLLSEGKETDRSWLRSAHIRDELYRWRLANDHTIQDKADQVNLSAIFDIFGVCIAPKEQLFSDVNQQLSKEEIKAPDGTVMQISDHGHELLLIEQTWMRCTDQYFASQGPFPEGKWPMRQLLRKCILLHPHFADMVRGVFNSILACTLSLSGDSIVVTGSNGSGKSWKLREAADAQSSGQVRSSFTTLSTDTVQEQMQLVFRCGSLQAEDDAGLAKGNQPFFLFGVVGREALEDIIKSLTAIRPVALYQEKGHGPKWTFAKEFESKTGKMVDFDVPLDVALLRCLKRTATLSVSANSSQDMQAVWESFCSQRSCRHVVFTGLPPLTEQQGEKKIIECKFAEVLGATDESNCKGYELYAVNPNLYEEEVVGGSAANSMGGRKMSQARKMSLVANGVKGLGMPKLVASVKDGKLVVEAGKESWFEAARTPPREEELERVKNIVIEEDHINAVDDDSWRRTFGMFKGMTIEKAFETALSPEWEGKKNATHTELTILAVNGVGAGSGAGAGDALSCQEYVELWHCHNQGQATVTIDVGDGAAGGMPAVTVHTDSSLTAGVTVACANVSASSSSKRYQVVEAGRHKLAVAVVLSMNEGELFAQMKKDVTADWSAGIVVCVLLTDGQMTDGQSDGPAAHSDVDLVLTRTKDTTSTATAAPPLPHKHEGLLMAVPVAEGGSSRLLMMSADTTAVGRAHLELSGSEIKTAVAVTDRLLGAGLLLSQPEHAA